MDDGSFAGQLYTLDPRGFPAREDDNVAWVKWFERPENRRLACTQLDNGLEITTIFLGIDRGDGIFFETVVWRQDEVVTDEFYDTRDDAMIGHDRLTERVRKMGR